MFLGRHQNTDCERFEGAADIPLSGRKLSHLLSGKATPDRHDRQIAAQGVGKLRRNVNARFAPEEPSVVTMMCRMPCLPGFR